VQQSVFRFDAVIGRTDDCKFLIRVSYMEIYNEEINDLVNNEGQKLEIHESLKVTTRSALDVYFDFCTSFAIENICCFLAAWSISYRFEGRDRE
jgi:hypothetical protein